MATHAYIKDYLYSAQKNLGNMLDFAVNTCDFEASKFFDMFLVSGIAEEFGNGNPKYISGVSGCELVRLVTEKVGISIAEKDEMYLDKSPEYWAGWALAYYQWHSGKSFAKIEKAVPIDYILNMYPTLHEADISKFVTILDEKLQAYYTETNLKCIRTLTNMSQNDLAYESGVKLRQIQLFEQRQRDINKAQVQTVAQLAKALGCQLEDLLE